MQTPQQVLGAEGEEVACRYLRSRKFDVRERNVRFGRYEIDIVAWDPGEKMMVFVEVKTRSEFSEQYPVRTTVGWEKRKAMLEAVGRWAVAHQYDGPGRTDVICVSGGRIVEHLMNIGSDFY